MEALAWHYHADIAAFGDRPPGLFSYDSEADPTARDVSPSRGRGSPARKGRRNVIESDMGSDGDLVLA
jgi:hypothetical protein